MSIIQVSVIAIFCFAGLSVSLIGMSGALLAWSGVFIVSLADRFQTVSPVFVGVLFLAAVFGEGLEFLGTASVARRRGASARGIRGAIVGGMAGAVIMSFFAPGIGSFAGAVAGTFSGAFALEYIFGRSAPESFRAGWGALAGRAAGSALKILVILASGLVAAAAYLGFL